VRRSGTGLGRSVASSHQPPRVRPRRGAGCHHSRDRRAAWTTTAPPARGGALVSHR